MRIVHLIAPAAVPGGAEQVVLLGAEAQQALRHDVTVVSLSAHPGLDDAFCAAASARGLDVRRVSARGVFDGGARSALRAHAMVGADGVLHAHGGRALGIASLVGRWPVVSTIHGLVTPTLRARLMATAERHLAARSAAVVVVSRQLEALLRRDGAPADRLFRIDNPVRLVTAAAAPVPRDPSTPIRLLMLSRLAREKGVDVGIAAVARVPGVSLDIAGEGPERPALQRLIDSLGVGARVRLCGAVADIGPPLRSCDGLLLSSRTEGQPLALLEALAAGVPAVASDVGGVASLIGDSDAGILVRPDDVDGLAAAIARFAAGHARHREAAQALAPTVLTRHAPETWARSMDVVYARALERPARRAGSTRAMEATT